MSAEDDVIQSIRDVFRFYFFKYPTEGNPLQTELTKTFVGIYDAYDPKNRFPVSKSVDGTAQGPTKPFVYRLNFDPHPIKWIADQDGDAQVDPAWKPSGKRRTTHLWNTRILFDPVHDDLTEMRAAGFVYAKHVAAQSPNARQVYGQNLHKIVDRPETITNDVDGPKFIKALAVYGTYDSDGDYFTKWRAGKQYGPYATSVTERYFKASFREVDLYEDQFYVIRQNELFTQIHLLHVDDKTGELGRIQYYGERDARYELTTYQKNKTLHDNFIFLYSVNGKRKTWVSKSPVPYAWKGSYDVDNPKGHSAYRRMVDVRAEVEGSIADKITGNELALKDEYEWFVEYVKAVFPTRLAVFRISEYEQGGLFTIDRSEIEAIKNHVYRQILFSSDAGRDFGGPIGKEVRAKLEELMKDGDVLVLPQGLKTGEHTRLVGGDSLFMYERELRGGTVYKVRAGDYLHNMYNGGVFGDVYEGTRGMIPFIQVVVWGGVIVTGGAVMGFSPAAIRAWLVRQAEAAVSGTLIKKLVWKFFRPAIITLVIELVLYIFEVGAKTLPAGQMTDFEGRALSPDAFVVVVRRMRFFAKGFFKGYVVNTIVDHLFEHLVLNTLEKGVENIREVKMYLLTKQTYAAIDRVRSTIRTIEDQLDGPAVHRATKQLQEATSRLARGAAGMFSLLYHLPYDEAKDALDLFGLDPKGKPPSPAQWEAEAQAQVRKIITSFQELTSLKDIDQALERLEHGKLIPIVGTLLVLESEIIVGTLYAFEHHVPEKWKSVVIVALIAIAVAGVAVADVATDGAVSRVGFELISDLIHLPQTDQEAERVGELVGNLFASLFFNSAVFDKEGKLGKFKKKHPILGGALWGNIKMSPLMAVIELVLKRYIILFDRVKADVAAFQGLTRAAGEKGFISALHAIEDKELEDQGYGHLKSFRTEDEAQASLQTIALAVFRIRHVIKSDLAEWIKTRYKNDIELYKADILEIAALGKAATRIDFEKGARLSKPLFMMLSHQLVQVLDEMMAMLHALFVPFTKGEMSWVELLQALGLKLGDIKKLQQKFIDEAKEELKEFKKQVTS